MPGRFLKIDFEILQIKELSSSDKLIFAFLVNGAGLNDGKSVTVSIKNIENTLGIPRRTIARSLEHLEQENLIEREVKKGQFSCYKIKDSEERATAHLCQNGTTNLCQNGTTPMPKWHTPCAKMAQPYTLYKKNIKRNIKEDGDNSFCPSYDSELFKQKAIGNLTYTPRNKN